MAFLIAFGLMFTLVALTLVLGAISKSGDRRVMREGRPTADQRLPSTRDVHAL